MSCKRIGLFILFSFVAVFSVFAQDFDQMRRDLQQKQVRARQEITQLKDLIQQYERQITETNVQFSALEAQYESLEREMVLRQKLINTLERERRDLLSEIKLTEENYKQFEAKLAELTRKYQKSLTYLYKHGRTSELVLLFTSGSVNQLLIRANYLRRFELERQKQALAIEEAKEVLRKKAVQLQIAKSRNDEVLQETRTEQKKLASRKEQQQETIKLMEKNRKELLAKLKITNEQFNNLNKVLATLIQDEEKIREAETIRMRKLEEERVKRLAEAKKIRDAKEREREVAKYSAPVATTLPNVGDLDEIEKQFIGLKGKLPWPVDGGAVAARYGTKVHPVYKTRIDNPGIEIAIEPRSAVRAVHDGYVLSVQPITGFGDVVIVNHGRYKSVYGNLSEVSTYKSAPIKQGDIVGLSGDENSAKGQVVFFMIWEKGKNIDPETWIAKK